MKKVLGIHWRSTDIKKDSRKRRKDLFKNEGLDLDLFQFDRWIDPTFESWEKTFDKIDFSKYKMAYTVSLWWIMLSTYLHKNKIKLKRLVMVVPWISFSTEKWLKPNMAKTWEDFKKEKFDLLVDEIIVVNAKDDEIVSFESWKQFSNKINANFIALEKWWHWLKDYLEFIVKLVKEGT